MSRQLADILKAAAGTVVRDRPKEDYARALRSPKDHGPTLVGDLLIDLVKEVGARVVESKDEGPSPIDVHGEEVRETPHDRDEREFVRHLKDTFPFPKRKV